MNPAQIKAAKAYEMDIRVMLDLVYEARDDQGKPLIGNWEFQQESHKAPGTGFYVKVALWPPYTWEDKDAEIIFEKHYIYTMPRMHIFEAVGYDEYMFDLDVILAKIVAKFKQFGINKDQLPLPVPGM